MLGSSVLYFCGRVIMDSMACIRLFKLFRLCKNMKTASCFVSLRWSNFNFNHWASLRDVAKTQLARFSSFAQRLYAGFAANAFNTIAYYVFYFGYVIQMNPIERPIRQKVGDLGEIIVLKYRLNPYQRLMRGLGFFGYIQHVVFQILQMVRFVPTEGFTLRVVYVIYYFALQLLATVLTYVVFKYDQSLPFVWNCVEANTKMCQMYGVRQAAKWKKDPIALMILIQATVGVSMMGSGMALLFASKPNLPAHIFYLLPEAWKPHTWVYLALLLWQTFLILAAITAMNYFVVIIVAFIFGTKVVAQETASSTNMSIPRKIRIFRVLEMVNQLFNEIARDFFLPVLSLITIITGVTLTYIALTRYGDPQLGLSVYAMVVSFDVMALGIVTLSYLQAGKYAHASAELIESIRTALKEPKALGDLRLQCFRKMSAALRPFDLKVGSYAKVNVETVKLLHETIVDYLMLFLEL